MARSEDTLRTVECRKESKNKQKTRTEQQRTHIGGTGAVFQDFLAEFRVETIGNVCLFAATTL